MIRQAVILAGGLGERLRPLTNGIPKPLVPVHGVPFLDYLFQSLVAVGIRKFLLLLGYKSQKIVDHCKGLSENLGLEIEYSIGAIEDATGRRLLNAHPLLDETFLLLYGDNYWPIELEKMTHLYEKKKAKALVTVFGNKNGTGEYEWGNNIVVANTSYVEGYDKKRLLPKLNGVDIGYYIFQKECLDIKKAGNMSLEEEMLPGWIAKQELIAYVTDTQYYYITDIPSLKRFEEHVGKNKISYLSK